MPGTADSTEFEIMMELMTDPDLAELGDEVLDYLDTDESIRERIEDKIAQFWPDVPANLETEADLDYLVKCEEQVRHALEHYLIVKLLEPRRKETKPHG